MGNWFLEPANVRKILSYLGGIKTKIYWTFLNPKIAGQIRDTLRRLNTRIGRLSAIVSGSSMSLPGQ